MTAVMESPKQLRFRKSSSKARDNNLPFVHDDPHGITLHEIHCMNARFRRRRDRRIRNADRRHMAFA